jgi:uncharacterized membrane protein
MSRLLAYFLRGLVVATPLALSIYVSWWVFDRIDSWLGLPYPGVGFLLTLALITLVGFLASNLITRGFLGVVERLFARLPFVRLLYASTRDLLDAFVGEKRRFDRPVLVTLTPGGTVKVLGFVTQPSLERLGLADHVAVYLPQSYNFAGNVIIVPATQVERVDADSSTVMAFIVSGGLTGGTEDRGRKTGHG